MNRLDGEQRKRRSSCGVPHTHTQILIYHSEQRRNKKHSSCSYKTIYCTEANKQSKYNKIDVYPDAKPKPSGLKKAVIFLHFMLT